MKSFIKRSLSVTLCLVMALTSGFYALSLTNSEKSKLNNEIAALQNEAKSIQNEINSLKAQKNNQNALLDALHKKISNTQSQISRCNQEINSINAKITANKSEIAANEKKIEKNKLAFKKRLRAIYMSNSDSSVKILLGAENFADFLQLAQLTSAVSSHDKAIIEDIVAAVKVLNEKNDENQRLLDEQVSIKSTIQAQQAELNAQEDEATAVYNQIAADQKESEAEKAEVLAQVKAKQKQLEDSIASRSYQSFINPNTGIQWPVSGFYGVSAEYKSNDAVHNGRHNGIDISGGNIAGQPIRAIADGYVTLVNNSCSHNYKKSGNCCGNGYGNYCVINHGTLNIRGSSANYVAYYAHAQRITVSNGQYVKQGDIIGYVGTTGWSTGYHLHLGVMKNNSWINPRAIL